MLKALKRLLSVVVSFVEVRKSNSNVKSTIAHNHVRAAVNIRTVATSVVGTYHAEHSQPCEDIFGEVFSDGKSAFYVIDGAGGECNGRLAAVKISRYFRDFLPVALTLMTDEQSIEEQLAEIFLVANTAALEARGRATLVLFISLPNGSWGVLQVGDAISLGKDTHGVWQMPIAPVKYSNSFGTSRNCTNLLGAAKIIEIDPRYRSGTSSFCEVVISSDWVCGNEPSAMIYDVKPNAIIGSYQVNQQAVCYLVSRMQTDGALIDSLSLQEVLLECQRGETALQVSNDDMTIFYGVIDESRT